MYKLFLLLSCFIFLPLFSFGQLSVGGGGAYSTSNENLGVQVRGMYRLNDQLRPSINFTYYIDGAGSTTITEFNAHLQYLGVRKEQFNIYGLVGINAFRVKIQDSTDTDRINDIGLDVGGGIDFKLSDKLSGLVEAKYDFSENVNQWVISLGVLRTF